MLRFELLENNNDFVSYRYFPEGKGESGTISVAKKDKKIVNEVVAATDEVKWYFFKMYKRIREYIDKDTFDHDGIIMWY